MLGPKPAAPKLETPVFNLVADLPTLEKQINDRELSVTGIRQGCQAKIVWADSTRKQKTKLVFLYIHGFSSTHVDGDPVHKNIAKQYAANLYLGRLYGHGIDLGDSTMAYVTAGDFIYSAEYALAVAKTLGDEVIVMGSSFGGALTIYLAAKHPEIKAIMLYSPCVKMYDERAEMLIKPWGLQLATLFSGSATFDYKAPNAEYARYWTTHYHLNGVMAFQNFLSCVMHKEIYTKVKCPVFMGYWYKNQQEQDKVASVPAMLNMFDELGTANKQKFAFAHAGNHCLTSPVLTKDVEAVQQASGKFLQQYFNPKQ
jgi:esterase/lipase